MHSLGWAAVPPGETPDGGWRAGLAGGRVGNRGQESPGIPDTSLPGVPRYKQMASDSSTAPAPSSRKTRAHLAMVWESGHTQGPSTHHTAPQKGWTVPGTRAHTHAHALTHALARVCGQAVGRTLAWSDEVGDAGCGLLTLASRQPS